MSEPTVCAYTRIGGRILAYPASQLRKRFRRHQGQGPPLAGSKATIERFRKEALLQEVNNPWVTNLLDCGEHDGLPYTVMEFVDGTDQKTNQRQPNRSGQRPLRAARIAELFDVQAVESREPWVAARRWLQTVFTRALFDTLRARLSEL